MVSACGSFWIFCLPFFLEIKDEYKKKIQCRGQCGQSYSGHKVMQQANIINITNKYEPQQKHRLGTVSKNYTGGLKPVLRDPNLALNFYHGSKHTVVQSA